MTDEVENRLSAIERAIVELFRLNDAIWLLHGRQPPRWSFKPNGDRESYMRKKLGSACTHKFANGDGE
jgi:hypothetical protein